MLRSSLPDVEISWLIERRFADLLDMMKDLTNVIVVDTLRWRKEFLSKSTIKDVIDVDRSIKSMNFDAVIDYQGLMKSGMFTLLSRSSARIGFDSKNIREPLAGMFYTDVVNINRGITNVILKNLQLTASFLNKVGCNNETDINDLISIRNYLLPKDIFKRDEDLKAELLNELKSKNIGSFILLHTGSSSKNKLLPISTQVKLCDILYKDYSLNVVLCGRGRDVEIAKLISERCNEAKPYVRETNTNELRGLIELSSAFIGSDSGPLHLASILGTNIVGLYGPTDPSRNGPINRGSTVIEASLPCRRRSCWKDCKDNICMQSIRVEEIVKKVISLIER
jgi:heptosyltransferase-1